MRTFPIIISYLCTQNKQSMYSHLEVEEGVYIPCDPASYPTDNAQRHLVEVKPPKAGARQYVFDEIYPYIDRSLSYRLPRNINRSSGS